MDSKRRSAQFLDPSRRSPPAGWQLVHAVLTAQLLAVRRCGEPVAAIGTLALHHAGQRRPRLGVDPKSGSWVIAG